jgi:hypothetical protein
VNTSRVVILGIALAAAALPVMAEENAIGRSLPGIWVMPQGGVVSLTPGFEFTVMPIGYIGSATGSRTVLINGVLVTNIHAYVSTNYLVPRYTYKIESAKVSLSSTFYLPINWQTATGTAQLNSLTRTRTDTSGGVSDVFFSPMTLGIHFSETNNLAIDTKIYMPTGAFQVGNLSNLGMNEWTFQPNLAWTYMWLKRGLELDNYVGIDIYSQNPTNKYTSGSMFHWDGMLIQYLSKRFGFGVIGSNLTQVNNDRGPLTRVLNGFQGRAWGAGPMALYVMHPKKPVTTLQFRWVPEFGVTNLLKGNTLLLGLTLQM